MNKAVGFVGVRGHDNAQSMLRRSLERGRLHHALVLAGPAGVGKRRMALGLACAVLCEVEPNAGCGRCDTCRRVLGGQHTDVVWLEGQGKSGAIRVQAARDVINSSLRAPYEGRAHFVILDPADKMMDQAANALLKTFEEPRPGVHYVLLTENPGDLIQTVRSRCTSLSLGTLDDATVREIVDEVILQRGLEVQPEAVAAAIDLADGRPGRAVELASDPSLPALRELLSRVLEASHSDRAPLFSGDAGPLWATWKSAVVSSHDPELVPEPEPPPAVISKGKKSRARTRKAKAPPVWGTPYQQRRTLARLSELWLVHLGCRLRDQKGLVKDPAPVSHTRLARQIRVVQQLQSSIDRNPNVRLALERALLDAGLAT